MHYFKSLNTLRAIAVLLVIFQHWSPPKSLLPTLLTGPLGVDIFFTLSGFLITGIILHDIKIYRQLNRPTSLLVGHFFSRRLLRIVPAYALALLLTYLMRSLLTPFDPAAWRYLLTFTFNLYVFKVLYWPGTISHFWTLAVEEQYYLFWPFMMVMVNDKFKPVLFISIIVVAILVRYIIRSNLMMFDVSTLSCLDAFGLGGLLAWSYLNVPDALIKIVKWLRWPAVILLLLIPVLNYFGWHGFIYLRRFMQAMISFVLIAYLVSNESKQEMPFRKFWDNRVLVFIGKISYGMYLYHFLIPDFLPFPWYINNIIKLFILVFFSWASFTFFETPILSLKKYFR